MVASYFDQLNEQNIVNINVGIFVRDYILVELIEPWLPNDLLREPYNDIGRT